MLIVTSDPKVKTLLEMGLKQRSDAFFGAFKWALRIVQPKVGAEAANRAAPKQHCPG